jgi:hypothetical protein
MYCSNCGSKASGHFCSECGTRLGSQAEEAIEAIVLTDWRNEIRYDVLLQVAEVRDLISRHAARACKRISGEQFLELCDKLFSTPVSLSTVATLAQSISARMGIHTGKSRSASVPGPCGAVLVATLCSLARHGQILREVHQGQDGCVFEAILPSDLRSLAGELVVAVHRSDEGSQVQARTKIPGQYFDWGKSSQCLSQLFEDLASPPKLSRAA